MIEPWAWLYQNLATIVSAISIIGTIVGMMWHLDIKIEKQGTRIDNLYELFIQQQKEFNDKFYELRKESDQKFAELRKESDLIRKESDQKFAELRKESDLIRKESDQKFYDLLKERK